MTLDEIELAADALAKLNDEYRLTKPYQKTAWHESDIMSYSISLWEGPRPERQWFVRLMTADGAFDAIKREGESKIPAIESVLRQAAVTDDSHFISGWISALKVPYAR